MNFEDVELFIVVLFIILIVMIVVTAVLIWVIRGDFHHYSLVEPRKRPNIGELYEDIINYVRHIWFNI